MADIYWVKDTVNADNVGSVNTFADPYGIQAAFDNVAAGDEVRIVTGSEDNYGAGSTSWNNRDAADKMINIDTTPGTGTAPILVSGWSDETTEALVVLDFEKASIVGSHGFNLATNYHIFKNIRITQAETDGFHYTSGVQLRFYLCVADNCGGVGFLLQSVTRCYYCQAYLNGSHGFNQGSLVYCEAYDNTGQGASGGDSFFYVHSVFDGNTSYGQSVDDFITYVNCTFEDNSSGVNTSNSNTVAAFINCAFTNNTDYGISGNTGVIFLEINCGFFGNGTAPTDVASTVIQENRVTTDPQYVGAGARNYAIGTNWKALGRGGFESGDMTGFVDIGAVQREEAGGGAGGLLVHPGTSGGARG